MFPTKALDGSGFYVVGGTMHPGALSYVERSADRELFDDLVVGKFCYVLTARQMGKSSLMIRTAARLRDAGIDVAVLDLTAVGQNVNPEQWYGGLIAQIGARHGFEDHLVNFWSSQPSLGPMHRWLKAVETVILPRLPGRLVIFVDEIDTVRGLPFPADEFFAGIRECYNRRSEDSDMQRVTFCLLGVATPSDLIRDTRTTPFNIGRRVELHDFTEAEAWPLIDGLRCGRQKGALILRRVLHWTGGHPYLTQHLCHAASQDGSLGGPADIDRLCEDLFFSGGAQERDDNLLFVRERLLRGDPDTAGLLGLYAKVRSNKIVRDDESDPLVPNLRLSGITRSERGRVSVRNAIYWRVFDKAWIAANMPDAELRRQGEAFRRGMWRMSTISMLVLLVVGSLAITAIKQRNRAEREASVNRNLLSHSQLEWAPKELESVPPEKVEESLTAVMYQAQFEECLREWENSNISRAVQLLEDTRPSLGIKDYRGFEWYWLWRLTHNDAFHLNEPYRIEAIKFLEGHILAIGEASATKSGNPALFLIKLYDLNSNSPVHSFSVAADGTFDLMVFSPDGKSAAVTGPQKNVILLDVHTGQRLAAFEGHSELIMSLTFSPDGKYLASGDLGGVIKVWDLITLREKRTIAARKKWVQGIAFSPDDRTLAAAQGLSEVDVWDLSTGRGLRSFVSTGESIDQAAFSPDGSKLVTTSKDGSLHLWDAMTRRITTTFEGHTSEVGPIAFSPDGKKMATGSTDRSVRLWDFSTAKEVGLIRGHGSAVRSVAWSLDGKTLVTGSLEGVLKMWDLESSDFLPPPTVAVAYLAARISPEGDTVALGSDAQSRLKLWRISTGQSQAQLQGPGDGILCGAFSKDGIYVATGGMDSLVKVWDSVTGELIRTLRGHTDYVEGLDFSPDGSLLASGGRDHRIIVWDLRTGSPAVALGSREVANSYRVVFSPDGKTVAAASHHGTVTLWDIKTGDVLTIFTGHTDQVTAIAFSPDGHRLATGGRDGTLRLWDVATGAEIRKPVQSDYLQRATFSPDGKRLLIGGLGGMVKLWDVTTWQELLTLKGLTGNVSSLCFSRDGMQIVASDESGNAKLWVGAAPH
jgi:WD40 repeat protein